MSGESAARILASELARIASSPQDFDDDMPSLTALCRQHAKTPRQLISQALDAMPEPTAGAARILLAIAPSDLLASLTRRRHEAAKRLDISYDTFLRRGEASLLYEVAAQLEALAPIGASERIGGTNSTNVEIARDLVGNLTIIQGEGLSMPVAVTIAVHEGSVLLVRRREPYGELDWQFPAGIQKPDEDPYAVCISETLEETGVEIAVTHPLGRRVHPVTGLEMRYFAARYISGTVENLDKSENRDARWVELSKLADLIPLRQVYVGVLRHLGLEQPQ